MERRAFQSGERAEKKSPGWLQLLSKTFNWICNCSLNISVNLWLQFRAECDEYIRIYSKRSAGWLQLLSNTFNWISNWSLKISVNLWFHARIFSSCAQICFMEVMCSSEQPQKKQMRTKSMSCVWLLFCKIIAHYGLSWNCCLDILANLWFHCNWAAPQQYCSVKPILHYQYQYQ